MTYPTVPASETRVRDITICELNSAEAVSGTDNLQLFASLRSRSDGINHLGLRRRKQTCHRATDLHAIPIRVSKTGWRIAQDTRKGAENKEEEEDKNASYTGSKRHRGELDRSSVIRNYS